MVVTVERPPVVSPAPDEDEAIASLDHALEASASAAADVQQSKRLAPALVDRDGSCLPIPDSVYSILHEVVHRMARGESITVVPRKKELTTQQAAEILNISRPFLLKLLERREIAYGKVGTHRRLRLEDVLAYRARRAAKRRKGIERLANKSQEMGIY